MLLVVSSGCPCLTSCGCSWALMLHVVVETRAALTPGTSVRRSMVLVMSSGCLCFNKLWMILDIDAARGC